VRLFVLALCATHIALRLSNSKKERMRFVLAFMVMVLSLSACDPCRNLDCLFNDYSGTFRIVRASNNSDLLFGAQRAYTPNELRFFTVASGDTTFFEHQAIYQAGTGYDSVLEVRFLPNIDTAFMRLGNGDVDTLKLTYKSFNTRCCGTITEVENFRHNNAVNLGGSRGVRTIVK
jgi:hypothetical protein